MAAICAILGGAPIGFLDGKGGPQPDFKIIEIAKPLGGKGGGSRCARQKNLPFAQLAPLRRATIWAIKAESKWQSIAMGRLVKMLGVIY